MTLRHRLAHWLGWHLGFVVSAIDRRGVIWIGFRCAHCGRLSGVHPSCASAPRPSEFRR